MRESAIKKEGKYLRGDLVECDFSKSVGSVKTGVRPALIISNDKGNTFSTTVTVAPVTSSIKRMDIFTHFIIDNNKCGLTIRSMCLLEQVMTVDKSQITGYIGHVSESVIRDI